MILWGPTRTGKTLLSRSFGRHSYFSGLFNIDNIDDDADYAVFDDIQGALSTSHLTNWIGAQAEFTCTDKYRHKRNITWGKPCIWCCNYDPRAASGVDVGWLDGNAEIVYIDEPIVSI